MLGWHPVNVACESSAQGIKNLQLIIKIVNMFYMLHVAVDDTTAKERLGTVFSDVTCESD